MTDNGLEQILAFGGGGIGIVLIISIIWSVLAIVLFFKIWVMTNDVSEMKDMLKVWLNIEHPVIAEDEKNSTTTSK